VPYVIAAGDRCRCRFGATYCELRAAPPDSMSRRVLRRMDMRAFSGQYTLVACFITEVVMTMMFLFIIMGATTARLRELCAAGDRTCAGQ